MRMKPCVRDKAHPGIFDAGVLNQLQMDMIRLPSLIVFRADRVRKEPPWPDGALTDAPGIVGQTF